MADGTESNSLEHLFTNASEIDPTGLLSYVRLGRPRNLDCTSSPTIANSTGHYVWDFLNWGITDVYGLEAFSEVTPNDSDVVPFGSMDQGRLFVRVSVQDLATLQLAYQRGLTALQRAQNKVEQLKEENQKLQSLVKNWSIKTTELTTETITLRQEISNLTRKMRSCFIPIDEHRELTTLLCHNICQMLEEPGDYSRSLTFNNLLKLVFSLPHQIHERLAHSCPNFDQFLNDDGSKVSPQRKTNQENSTTAQNNDKVSPDRSAATFKENNPRSITQLSYSFKDHKPDSTVESSSGSPITPIENAAQLSAPEETPSSIEDINKPDLPARNYSSVDLSTSANKPASAAASNDNPIVTQRKTEATALDRLDALMIAESDYKGPVNDTLINKSHQKRCISVPEPVYAEVKIENPPNTEVHGSRSQSSGLGTPLAQSTPFGTMSNMKHQVIPKPKRKRKRKISRWNFAARLCSSGRSTTMSDSESMESAIYLQTGAAKLRTVRHHGRQPNKTKRPEWFFKNRKT